MQTDYIKELNPEQLKAVNSTEGPVLVLAGPGTGKTQLLSIRASNIIGKNKAKPENILILSYTNAAAKAMKERLVRILGGSGYDIETATFHSFANSIILESDEAVDYIQERIQITDTEKVKALEYILDNTEGIDAARPFRAPYIYRKELESRISELKKEGITPAGFEAYLRTLKPDGIYVEEKHMPRLKALACVYKLYEEYKGGKNKDLFDERGRYDFDDMIIFALDALKNEKELKSALRKQYKYIMVDEFQDTNGAQLNLLFELIDPAEPNICCVGDDDQSIYRFQGASLGNFRELEKRFPKIKIISLKENYRSTKEICDLSHQIISNLPDSERVETKPLIPKKEFKKKTIEFHEFTSEAEELLFAADKVQEAKAIIEKSSELSNEERSLPYNNIAVLVRKREDILKVIDVFLGAGVPYATDGKEDISFEKRVRQMTDVLRLAYMKDASDLQLKDSVFYRVISSDYLLVRLTDILKFIGYVKSKKKAARAKKEAPEVTLFCEFLYAFSVKDAGEAPSKKETDELAITKEIKFENPYAMHRAGWVIKRLIDEAQTRPVHSTLLRYINDAGVFKHILKAYADDAILRIRDLRALSSFVNMVKESDISNPAISLSDFIEEMEMKSEHGIALRGELVTESQEGVRIFTAHGSKGLEFHTVIIPFCIQNDNWPTKPHTNTIPLPPDIFKAKTRAGKKETLKDLNFYDETRLFYVASTRAKSSLIYTSSPAENAVSSSYISNIGLTGAGGQGSKIKEEQKLVKFLHYTGKEDPFTGTEAILSDLVKNMSLNPTSLNNYITCKRKFLYDDVLMLPSEKRLSLVFGNCVHKALEDTYGYFVEKNKFPDFAFFKKSFERELRYQGVEKAIRLGCLRHLNTLKGWFESESKAPVRPIGLEKKLSVMLDKDLIFTGKYDKTEIAEERAKLVRVVDYKTGAPDDHLKKLESGIKDLASDKCEGYLRQLVSYKLLFDRAKDQNKGFKVSEGVLVFIEPVKASAPKYGLKKGEFVNKTVKINDDMVAELENVINEAWKNIQALAFDKLQERDGSKCRNCDFDYICWG